jgi:hypothetical protein
VIKRERKGRGRNERKREERKRERRGREKKYPLSCSCNFYPTISIRGRSSF